MSERIEWRSVKKSEAENIRDTIAEHASRNGMDAGDICISGNGNVVDVWIEVNGHNQDCIDDLKTRAYLGLRLPDGDDTSED